MNLLQAKAKVLEANICPVLSEHIINFVKSYEGVSSDLEVINAVNTVLLDVKNSPNIGYFKGVERSLVTSYKVPEDIRNACFDALDMAGKLYVVSFISSLRNEEMKDLLDELKKISKLAHKLKMSLPTKNSQLLGLLAIIDQIEKGQSLPINEKNNGAVLFFNHANEVLDELIRLPTAIPNSPMGQRMKLGVKSAKGNQTLKLWIEQFYEIWTVLLNRNFEFDGKNGVNGRTRFTNFVREVLHVIHPAIPDGTVENAVTSFLRKKTNLVEGLPPKKIV